MQMQGEQVIGHYVAGQQGEGWQAALAQSTDLFKALVADDLTAFEKQLASLGPGAHSSWHTVLCWSAPSPEQQNETKAACEAKSRTLAQLATQHGSVRVLSFLLSSGADPAQKARDEADCYTLMDQSHPNAATIKGMLDDAAGNWPAKSQQQSGSPSRQPAAPAGQGPDANDARNYSQQQACPDGISEPTDDQAVVCDLTRPEYSTDWFRMYCFKVLRCSKRYAHDWRACPFAHPTENARRRDPREFKYSSLVCPDYRQGCCVRGDTCQYAHGVFESWLHPSRYRTQLCKDTQKCDRVVCFFAHSLDELRTPENSFVPGPEERLRVPKPMQAVLGIGPPAGLSQLQVPQLDTYAPDQNTQLDLMLQQPGMVASSSSGALNRAASSTTSFGSNSQVAGAIASAAAAGDDQQQQQQAGSSSGDVAAGGSNSTAQPSPKPQQLVSPTALPMPRMSNAFARKHGLDPKENPLVNLQRLAMQQMSPQAAGMGGAPPSGSRRGKRGTGGQQGYPPQPPYSPQPQFQQPYQQQFQQYPQQSGAQSPVMLQPQFQQPYQQQYQQYPQQSGAQSPVLLQPLTLQPPQQLLQPGILSPAAAYYGSASPMQPVAHSPASPMLDPNAMALLFGGINITGHPLSPCDPAAAMAAGMVSPQLHGYAMGMPSPGAAGGMQGVGMLSPMGASGMLSPVPDGSTLGGQSPLPESMMHAANTLHSPY